MNFIQSLGARPSVGTALGPAFNAGTCTAIVRVVQPCSCIHPAPSTSSASTVAYW